MTTNNTQPEELRRSIGDVMAYLKADRLSGSEATRQVMHLYQSHKNKAISDVLDKLSGTISVYDTYSIPGVNTGNLLVDYDSVQLLIQRELITQKEMIENE